ncbi:twin-arginine translocation signal domain-containing protein [uncultured Roseobacter sp.]|uniref:twin-arginine translocation signal domain-containing protein n=1 Tax=uncultured Roseobacter sp. TaxID=114847 RepID=UPI0026371B33|nr:twin-arginine translocation signal domain-containing protein [uncultured Roseobacter sp.]
MSDRESLRRLTRRDLLKATSAAGASFVVGAGFLAAPNAAWATQMDAIKPETFATLVQMARDIYPHDKVPDEHYVIAVKGYDTPESADMISTGIAALDARAQELKGANYLDIGWERDRVDVLRSMEEDAFFQTVRGGLVTGLYNQKAVWPIFGYEGSSFEHGGYIDRGFDDINWI